MARVAAAVGRTTGDQTISFELVKTEEVKVEGTVADRMLAARTLEPLDAGSRPSPRRSGTATSSATRSGEPELLYIDLHLVHEVTSAQAFDGLRLSGRKVRRPDLTLATMDHNVPTTDRSLPIDRRALARRSWRPCSRNCAEFGIRLFDMLSPQQGIVHIIGPELGLTQPGMTIVCGDSHTATHGAFGALAFGIGTSEVEHVLATQMPAAGATEDDGGRGRRARCRSASRPRT